jgi:fumarylacetoacetase
VSFWTLDETHDPHAPCWVQGADGHADFPVHNLPLGLFSDAAGGPRAGVAIGDSLFDLAGALQAGLLPDLMPLADLAHEQLNELLAAGPEMRRAWRKALFALLTDAAAKDRCAPFLVPMANAEMHLPCRIGDYTDFYAGIHHAQNIGKLFRPDAPLLPNYKHVPIGYHGRASSVRPSGAVVNRPSGQLAGPDGPRFAPCERLDYELELGIWIGTGNDLGTPVAIAEAHDHIAGYCLLNDWSARDIQAWEYQPLGPFLAKNFLTTISPWIITPEALAPFRVAQGARPDGDPAPLPYLHDPADQAHGALALTLEVYLSTAAMRDAGEPEHRLSIGDARHLYWTPAQMLAHHTSGGCDLQPGDLFGTGTISGPERGQEGSLMEISVGGKQPVHLPGGETRTFLLAGDRIRMQARATAPGRASIGFGECAGMVVG